MNGLGVLAAYGGDVNRLKVEIKDRTISILKSCFQSIFPSVSLAVLEVCPSCKHQIRLANSHTTTANAAVPVESKPSPLGSGASTPPTPGFLHNGGGGGAGGGQLQHCDLLEQKRIADALDKMCPMCAKLYSASTTFDAFQEHVESHFVDATDAGELLDGGSMERNFELVSQTVGDF